MMQLFAGLLRTGPMRVLRMVLCFGVMQCAVVVSGCGAGVFASNFSPGVISNSPTNVSVPPLAGEDLVAPCVYQLYMPQPGVTQAGTLVIFDRADTQLVWFDAGLRAQVAALHYSMVLAQQCNSVSHDDLQPDATLGPGRMLLAAMTQFGLNTGHPELENGGLVLFGFSAAGVLAVSVQNYKPARVLAVALMAPADAYLNISEFPVSNATALAPALLMANGQDPAAGTQLSLNYFKQGRALNAPWTLAVQHATGHCCTTSSLPLLIPWLNAITPVETVGASASPGATQKLYAGAAATSFTCTPNGVGDSFGTIDCVFSAAAVTPVATLTTAMGWVPDATTAAAWLAWVTNPTTNSGVAAPARQTGVGTVKSK